MKVLPTLLLGILVSGIVSSGTAAALIMPTDVGTTNVKDAAYGAKGDGVTDDTRAIHAALDKGRSQANQNNAGNCYYYPQPQTVYFPAGTYLVTDSIDWISCAMSLQGAGTGATVIKLKSNSPKFANASSPKAVVKTRMAGNLSHLQFIYDMTILVGSGNPGAIGVDFIASNVGGMENVEIISEDLAGVVGLDMSRQWPGPCLIKNVKITGFNYGIRTNQAEYGPTFEHITLTSQKTIGFYNQVNVCAVRDLQSTNTVSAVSNTGVFILLGGNLQGGSSAVSAIANTTTGTVYARGVTTAGYRSAISRGTAVVAGNSVTEYLSDTVRYLFPGTPKRSLNLPIEETPTFRAASLGDWGKIVNWGYSGDAGEWTKVFASGKPVVYFPSGVYLASNTAIDVPTSVKLVTGNGCQINNGGTTALTLNVTKASTEPLIIEKFNSGVTINHQCSRPVVLRHGNYNYVARAGAGKLYTEDISADNLVFYPGQKVWMRQHNPEGPNLHITNNGAQLWILGIKTEGTGTLVKTTGGGLTEVLGTVVYPVNSFASLPNAATFICQEAGMSAIYRVSVYSANQNYPVQIDETRKGTNKKLTSNTSSGFLMPLFAGFDSTIAVGAASRRTGVSGPPGTRAPVMGIMSERQLRTWSDRGAAAFALYDLRGRQLQQGTGRKLPPQRRAGPAVVVCVKQ